MFIARCLMQSARASTDVLALSSWLRTCLAIHLTHSGKRLNNGRFLLKHFGTRSSSLSTLRRPGCLERRLRCFRGRNDEISLKDYFPNRCMKKGSSTAASRVLFENRDPMTVAEEYDDLRNLEDLASQYPKPEGVHFSYGTAGFRSEAASLSSTVMRAGIIAALRALQTTAVTGLMVTASHNPVQDNGVKIADPSGGMLAMAWEDYCNLVANAETPAGVREIVERIAKAEGIDLQSKVQAKVLLARDTRPSGAELAVAAKAGIESVPGVTAEDLGILTTPQLHWLVRAANREGQPGDLHGNSSEGGYFESLASGFQALMELSLPSGAGQQPLLIDGANGVGAMKLRQLAPLVAPFGLTLEVRNAGEGELNHGVGADFVQKELLPPGGFGALEDLLGRRCVSIDGDADRLVYFYVARDDAEAHEGGIAREQAQQPLRLRLLDGDKIAALAARFFRQQLHLLAAQGPQHQATSGSLGGDGVVPAAAVLDGYGPVRVGVVQTAYANGASTAYLAEQKGLEVVCTATGVKHLHAAAEKFDIGVYFEANGHGTILFKDSLVDHLASTRGTGGAKQEAVACLLAASRAVNQAVGDALSGVLLVEAVLRQARWQVQDWDALYTDLPSRQLKVKVADRRKVVTSSAETSVLEPQGLQAAIDAEVAKHPKGRSFVRPSGTEDVVRVYAEAATRAAADELASSVAACVMQFPGL